MNETRERAVERLMALPAVINEAEEWAVTSAWNLALSQDALTDAESAARISGECDGPNAEARAAQARAKTVAERLDVRTDEHKHAEARSHLSALQSELDALRAVAVLLQGMP